METITLREVKSFLKKNKDNIWKKEVFAFDGTTDSCYNIEEPFIKMSYDINYIPSKKEGGKYHKYEDEEFKGYSISHYNRYGYIIAIRYKYVQ